MLKKWDGDGVFERKTEQKGEKRSMKNTY